MRAVSVAIASIILFGGAGCGGGDDGGSDIDAGIDAPPAPPSVSIAATATRGEGNSGTITLAVPVTLSRRSSAAVSVRYTTADGTAASPADYTAASGTLTIPAGTTTASIMLALVPDRLDEDDETFTVTLSEPDGVTLDVASSTVTITDDDAMPALTVAPATVAEGPAAGLAFVVTLSAASGRPVSVRTATADGTATAPADFTAVDAVLDFAPGDTMKTVSVAVLDDALDEDSEALQLRLSDAVAATIMTAQAAGTITDDDLPPTVSVAPVSASEGAGTLDFEVSLSGPSGKPISVAYATANGNATAGLDYTTTMGVRPFAPGETVHLVSVPILQDALDELDETVRLTLSAPMNATLGTAQASGTILDDDASPTVSIAATASLVEGNTGSTTGTIDVTLSAPTAVPVTVSFETSDGTALAPADYGEAAGTLTFAAGSTTLPVRIEVAGDTLDEDDETLTVRLTFAQGATLAAATSTVTIVDDDAAPSLSVSAATAAEGGARGLRFVVGLSAASARPVTVAYTTASGTAALPDDYAAASGTLELAPGETSAAVTVALVHDALDERDETVQLLLSAPVNAILLTDQALGTITDDDPTPTLAIEDAIVVEGAAAATTTLSFPVRLSAASGQAVSVNYGTTAGSATAGVDYVTAADALIIPAGATGGTIDVVVSGDGAVEADEMFTVTLSAPTNASILGSPTAGGTILDDDAGLPALAIDDPVIAEGNAGASALVFTVTLDQPAAGAVTVAFAAAAATATDQPGAGGNDFLPTAGVLSFAPGDNLRTITVPILGDVQDEADESVRVILSAASGASIADAVGIGAIVDDDGPPLVSAAAVVASESAAALDLRLTLSAASGRTITVDYATADGTAIAGGHATTGGEDYLARSGTVTFLPGETSKRVPLTVVADLLDEADETFTVALADPTGAALATASVEVTITDDDAAPTLAIADRAIVEGTAGAGSSVAVPVTLSAPSGRTITVQYATGDAPPPTATAGDDYTGGSGTLTFTPGITSQLVRVPVLPDAIDEPAERFAIDLAGPTGAIIADAQGLVTIASDDSALPALSISNPAGVVEGAGVGNTTMTFTVTLGRPSATAVTVTCATAMLGTATAGTDFTAASQLLTFNPGETSKTFAVTILGDVFDEPAETVVVAISGNSANSNLLDAQAQGTIVDNDATPTISVANIAVNEGQAAGTATFTVTMSSNSGQPVTVEYGTRDGTASEASGLGLDDYEGRAGVLFFPPGTSMRQVQVPVQGDRILEPNETFFLELAAAQNASIVASSATSTLNNDDAQPALVVAGGQVDEGLPGAWAPLPFTITLSAPALVPVTVTFSTANGTAVAGIDYGAVTASVTFAPGTVAVTRPVFVFGDTTVESNETVNGRLTNAIEATIMTANSIGTINNDD